MVEHTADDAAHLALVRGAAALVEKARPNVRPADLESLVEKRSAEVVQGHRAVVMGIAKLAEYRDNETGLHVERMCAFSAMLAREYSRRFGGLDDAWIEDLELAASLHDIGKVSIPDSILLKPGKLTKEEFDEMKRRYGMTDLPFRQAAAQTVGAHIENAGAAVG